MLLNTDHNPSQYPDLAKLYPMLLKPLVRKTDKSHESHKDPNAEFQTQAALNMTDDVSFSQLNTTLDMQPLGAEPLNTTSLFEDDGPMDPRWLQV